MQQGSIWQLQRPCDGFSRPRGNGLATQIAAGRRLRLLDAGHRWRVRTLEDGYPCWIEPTDLQERASPSSALMPPGLDRSAIVARLDAVLSFALQAMNHANSYLWGGTLGPNFDCSGLVQTAFAQAGVWIPRDAYLQERFCRAVAVRPGCHHLLVPGDLIFFGTPQRCTHVGLHLGDGRYLHSSGREHGRNGIGIDDLHPRNEDPVARHYREELRGAGRIMHSHDGSPLPP